MYTKKETGNYSSSRQQTRPNPLRAVTAHRAPAGAPSRIRILLLGSGPLADTLALELQQNPLYEYVGCLSEDKAVVPNGRAIWVHKKLEEIVTHERIACIVVTMYQRRGVLPIDQLLACKMNGIQVEDGLAFYEKLVRRISLLGLNPSFLVFNDGFQPPSDVAKRIFDVLVASALLLLMLPLLALLPALIKLTSRGPVFYRQERVGYRGKHFTLLKFRSMTLDAEQPGCPVWAKEDDERITPLGTFLRKFRLDEIPQLFNILKGDMSFVGPRPERPEFVKILKEAIPYYELRYRIKPGLTGWAQVMYRYGANVQEAATKLEYDLYYIKRMCVSLDCRILFKTIKTVLSGSGGR